MASGNQQLGFAIRAVNEASAAMKAVSGDVEKIGKAAGDADPKLEKAGQETKQLGDAAEHAHGPLGKMSGALGDVAKIAGGFIVAGALMKLPGLFQEGFGKAASLAGELRQMQRELGSTAEQASAMHYQFEATGVSFETGEKSLIKFSKALAGVADIEDLTFTTGKPLLENIKALGVSVNYSTGELKPMAEILPGIADKFAVMPNGIEKTALATQLFGKSGADLIPFLNKGSAGLKELGAEAEKLGLVLDQKTIDAMKKQAIATREMNAALDGVKVQIGVALTPVVTFFALQMRDLAIEVNQRVVPAIRDIAEKLTELTAALVGPLMPPLREFMGIVKDLGSDALKAAADGVTALGSAFTTFISPSLSGGIDLLLTLWPIIEDYAGEQVATAAEMLKKFSAAALALAGAEWTAMKEAWEIIQPLLEKAAAYTWGALTDLANASWDVMKDAFTVMVEQMNKIHGGKLKDAAQDTSNWAAAWDKARDALQPAVDVLLPKLQGLWSALKADAKQLGSSLSGLGDAFGELWKAIEPLHPLIEPLAQLLGKTFLLALGAVIDSVTILAAFFTLSLTASIETVRLAVLALAKVMEGIEWTIRHVVIPAFHALVGATEDAAGWIGHWMNVAGEAFNGFKNMVMGPINEVLRGIQSIIDKAQAVAKFFGSGGADFSTMGPGQSGGGGGGSSTSNQMAGGGGGGGGTIRSYIGGGQYADLPTNPSEGDLFNGMRWGSYYNPVSGGLQPGWSQNAVENDVTPQSVTQEFHFHGFVGDINELADQLGRRMAIG